MEEGRQDFQDDETTSGMRRQSKREGGSSQLFHKRRPEDPCRCARPVLARFRFGCAILHLSPTRASSSQHCYYGNLQGILGFASPLRLPSSPPSTSSCHHRLPLHHSDVCVFSSQPFCEGRQPSPEVRGTSCTSRFGACTTSQPCRPGVEVEPDSCADG